VIEAPPILKDHQEQALAAVDDALAHGITKPVLSMATGTGKTVTFAELLRRRGGTALVLAHQEELINQAARTIAWVWPGVRLGIVQSTRDEWEAPVVVASVPSLRPKRLQRWEPDRFRTVVVDEAHHAVAASHRAVLRYLTPELLVGVTATPFRGDRASLAQIFDRVVYTFGILDAIGIGALVDLVAYQVYTATNLDTVRVEAGDFVSADLEAALNTADRNAGVVAAYKEYAPHATAVTFCVGLHQAEDLAEAFQAHGIPAEAVHGQLTKQARHARLDAFHDGTLRVLTSVGVLTEGWDEPKVSCILMARPTKSLALYTQMVGRGLRTFPGKAQCLMLDFVDASTRHKIATVADLFGLRRLPTPGERLSHAVRDEQAARESFAALAARLFPRVNRLAVPELFDQFIDTAVPPDVDWRDLLDDLPTRRTTTNPASPQQVRALIGFGWPTQEASELTAAAAYEALQATLDTQREWAAARAPLWAEMTGASPDQILTSYYSRPWHFQRPSEKQRALCQKLRLTMPAGATAGEVSLLIDHRSGGLRDTPYTPPPESKETAHGPSAESGRLG
jgi:superfamily II DNA or RNA helicase